ncbi:MAG: DUF2798 domain-containing protein [Gallionella sp.]|nr:DUF2798 domain-containing protein [Gallionella sp.]MDD4959801.1 DUF2798 domain-containing protein [Gallionella sp.]
MKKLPKNRFHLIFSLLMGAVMVTLMTGLITSVNIGFPPDFLHHWGKAILVAYPIAVPIIYFLAPIMRHVTARWVEMP